MVKSTVKFFKLNKVIWLLTFSDIFSWGFYLSVTSLVGIYLSRKLTGNAVEVVGIGIGVYYLVRAVSQIPIGMITDKIKKDRDDLIFLTTGNMLLGLPFLFYPIIQAPIVFYILQAIVGLGASMNLVTWRKLFARNLDTDREGISYAVYDTVMSIATGVFSLLAGLIANINQEFFDGVMMFIGITIMLSSIMPALIFDVKDRDTI